MPLGPLEQGRVSADVPQSARRLKINRQLNSSPASEGSPLATKIEAWLAVKNIPGSRSVQIALESLLADVYDLARKDFSFSDKEWLAMRGRVITGASMLFNSSIGEVKKLSAVYEILDESLRKVIRRNIKEKEQAEALKKK